MTDKIAIDLKGWERIAVNGSFEEAMSALEIIVDLLDNGNLPLQTSVQCFEVGGKLSSRCQQLLSDAELRISQVQPVIVFEDPDREGADELPF